MLTFATSLVTVLNKKLNDIFTAWTCELTYESSECHWRPRRVRKPRRVKTCRVTWHCSAPSRGREDSCVLRRVGRRCELCGSVLTESLGQVWALSFRVVMAACGWLVKPAFMVVAMKASWTKETSLPSPLQWVRNKLAERWNVLQKLKQVQLSTIQHLDLPGPGWHTNSSGRHCECLYPKQFSLLSTPLRTVEVQPPLLS